MNFPRSDLSFLDSIYRCGFLFFDDRCYSENLLQIVSVKFSHAWGSAFTLRRDRVWNSRCSMLMQIKRSCFGKNSYCSFVGLGVIYLRALKRLSMDKFREKWRDLVNSRGCLGCCTKSTPVIAVDEPSKGLRIQGRTVKEPSISDDFCSTSTYEMDNSAVQSQRSVSSISTSNQTFDPHSATGGTSNPSEFVNHGLLLWNQTRQQWIGNRKSEIQKQQVREPRLSWNATYDSLLGTNKRFTQPIPLSEMVDFLVDIWDQEGLYDWS
ncbi:hypothetical protein HHK36_013936 [Tetracentron sinense]|uniref:Gag1-like clamp domain-containing protein n=1 Tax=Tetracentron sinense TaxID=13715 RepID=A0A835DH83_TETSI|nr:hypothetical protein HHK36_013936 [Tetracentron sinense]